MSTLTVPPVLSSPRDDAMHLYKAFKGLGCDTAAVINILAHRDASQRALIENEYKTMYHEELTKRLSSELSGNVKKAVLLWMPDPARRDAMILHDALTTDIDLRAATEVICSRTPSQIQYLKQLYHQLYGTYIEHAVQAQASGDLEQLLLAYLSTPRSEGLEVDRTMADHDAKALFKAGEKRLGTDEKTFRVIFSGRSRAHMAAVSEEEVEVHEEEKNEAELRNSFHGSSEVVSEIVSEEKESETKVEKVTKPRFFTRSKTVSFVFLMFLVACFSVSFTDLPPMDLPIYEEVGFKEVYHESLKLVAFAKESFDDVLLHVKQWSIDFVSYLSDQKSQFFATREISSIQFYNLTVSPPREEFVFNRHIGTDYIHEVQEVEEELANEMEMMEEEENYEEMEVDEVVTEEVNEIETAEQIHGDDVEAKSDLEDVYVIKSEAILETQSEMLSTDPEIESISSVDHVPEAQPNMLSNDPEVESTESGSVDPVPEAQSEVVTDGPKIQSSSETLSSLSRQSINTIYLAGVSMVIMAAASAIFYMKKGKSKATKPANVRVTDDDMCSESCSAESSSVQKGFKKKSGYNKKESLASSSTDLSMGSSSYGSFTTYERIPIKHGEEVLMTPIRRSSRLNKSQVTSS